MEIFVCTAQKAMDLMKHLKGNEMVILSVMDTKTHIHDTPKKIKKKNGEELIKQADNIQYQNNDFFGTLSLYGVLKEKDNIIHSILFPQLE